MTKRCGTAGVLCVFLLSACSGGAGEQPGAGGSCGTDDDCGSTSENTSAAPRDSAPTGTAILATVTGSVHEFPYSAIDGRAMFEGDIDLGSVAELAQQEKGIGVEPVGRLWPSNGGKALLPFVINASLGTVMRNRINTAVANWNGLADANIFAHGLEADYVEFVSGSGCSSSVGRQGGRQTINLSFGKLASDIVGSDISSFDTVYTWFSDGYVTAGSSTTLDEVRPQYPYTLPPGETTASIAGIAIAPSSDRVYTWYTDFKFSIGTSNKLDAVQGLTTYTLPAGRTPAMIVDMAISRTSGKVYTWYNDSTLSIGVSNALGTVQPNNWTPAAGETIAAVVGIGINSADRTYAWYGNKKVSAGASTDFDSSIALAGFNPPGDCNASAITHELGHALGLFHEQSRCDRDSFVTVFTANIAAGMSGNFTKLCDSTAKDIGSYDLASLMHYSSFAFSKDGVNATILKKDGSQITPPGVLSAGDISAIATLY